jgi:hypothetical protein
MGTQADFADVSNPFPQIILFDRKELLRRILESGWEDQKTGVEEVSNDQMLSAQESMMRWLVERGEFSLQTEIEGEGLPLS